MIVFVYLIIIRNQIMRVNLIYSVFLDILEKTSKIKFVSISLILFRVSSSGIHIVTPPTRSANTSSGVLI